MLRSLVLWQTAVFLRPILSIWLCRRQCPVRRRKMVVWVCLLFNECRLSSLGRYPPFFVFQSDPNSFFSKAFASTKEMEGWGWIFLVVPLTSPLVMIHSDSPTFTDKQQMALYHLQWIILVCVKKHIQPFAWTYSHGIWRDCSRLCCLVPKHTNNLRYCHRFPNM